MKIKKLLLQTNLVIILCTILISICGARQLNLLSEPTVNAKTVGTVDLSVGIIPIFTPQNSEWMKVADPRNGNVGWVKTSDIHAEEPGQTVTLTQKIINQDNKSGTQQIIQFGQPKPISSKEAEQMMLRLQAQQRLLQQEIQRATEMLHQMTNFPAQNVDTFGVDFYPLFMPIVVTPASKNQQPGQSVSPKIQTPTTPNKK